MKTRTTTALIISSIIAVLSLAGYYFAFSYVDGLSTRTEQATADASYAETKYNIALSHKVVANSGESQGAKLDEYILPDGGEITIIKELESIAGGLSLSLITDTIEIQSDNALSAQNKELLHLVVITSGSLSETRRFQSILETLPYNVRFNEVDLTAKNDSSEGSGLWQGRFDFSIVKQKTTDQ